MMALAFGPGREVTSLGANSEFFMVVSSKSYQLKGSRRLGDNLKPARKPWRQKNQLTNKKARTRSRGQHTAIPPRHCPVLRIDGERAHRCLLSISVMRRSYTTRMGA